MSACLHVIAAHGHTHGGMSHNHSHNGTNHNHSHNGHNGHTHKKKRPHQDKKSDQDSKFTGINSGKPSPKTTCNFFAVNIVFGPFQHVEQDVYISIIAVTSTYLNKQTLPINIPTALYLYISLLNFSWHLCLLFSAKL